MTCRPCTTIGMSRGLCVQIENSAVREQEDKGKERIKNGDRFDQMSSLW